MPTLLYTYLCGIIILSGLDCILTLIWIESGAAIEVNLFLGALLEIHPLLFTTVKILLVSIGVSILWYFRDNRFIMPGATIAFSVYVCTIVWHMYGFLAYWM